MYAVIETGDKQYEVQEGNKLRAEKLDAQIGDIVTSDKVLSLDDGNVKVGRPHMGRARVEAKVLEQSKTRKIVAYKFKAKKNYRSKREHRQPYTFIEIRIIA